MITAPRVMSAPRRIAPRPTNSRECSVPRADGGEHSPSAEGRRRKPEGHQETHDEVRTQEHDRSFLDSVRAKVICSRRSRLATGRSISWDCKLKIENCKLNAACIQFSICIFQFSICNSPPCEPSGAKPSFVPVRGLSILVLARSVGAELAVRPAGLFEAPGVNRGPDRNDRHHHETHRE